jgi:hypothetical protein
VRARAVRAGGDNDREGGRLGAELVEQLLHPPGQLALGPAGEGLGGETSVRLARQRGGPPDRVELGRVLDRAQLLDEAAARDEVEPAGAQGLVARVREVVGLEADAPVEELREVRDERPPRLDDLDVRDRPRRLGVPEVGEQPHPLVLDEERRVRARESRQVAHIRAVRNEQRLVEPLAEPLDPAAHRPAARYSSASR